MDVSPLKIGSLTIPVPLCLAPMAGYTRMPFRSICRRFHCGLVFTELVTADGIVRRQPKTLHYLASSPEERPVAAHIYGADPDSLAFGMRMEAVLEPANKRQGSILDIKYFRPAK